MWKNIGSLSESAQKTMGLKVGTWHALLYMNAPTQSTHHFLKNMINYIVSTHICSLSLHTMFSMTGNWSENGHFIRFWVDPYNKYWNIYYSTPTQNDSSKHWPWVLTNVYWTFLLILYYFKIGWLNLIDDLFLIVNWCLKLWSIHRVYLIVLCPEMGVSHSDISLSINRLEN